MKYRIRLGRPRMEQTWAELERKNKVGIAKKNEIKLYKKWGKTMALLSNNPFHNSLNSHEITDLTEQFGSKVFQSYIENNTSGALRLFWAYGPDKGDITVISIDPHPEDKKNGSYKRIKLDSFPK